jgi:hypothetical protein
MAGAGAHGRWGLWMAGAGRTGGWDRSSVMDDVVGALAARGVVGAADARGAGLDARALQKAYAAERLVRVRPDAYVSADEWARLDPGHRYRLVVTAASRALGEPTFSHLSAAVVWDLPLIGTWPAAVHVTGGSVAGGRSWRGVVHHGTTLAVPAVVRHNVVVTDVPTTVCDVARVAPFATALAMADHALRTRATTPDALTEAAARLGARRGSRAARRVAEHADGRSESPGESLSRARMIELAAPVPALQHDVIDARGLVGRADFYWENLRLVGEFDGRLKYRVDGIQDTAALENRVWTEKVREDRLRATGLGVTRWTWQTALNPHLFAAHLRAACVL